MSPNGAVWQIIGQTVKGARKAVNQDSHDWKPFGDGSEVALTIADGHGSSAHPRSHVGATMAVGAFLEAATRFRALIQPGDLLKQLKPRAEDDLPRNVVRGWQQRIETDLKSNPVADPGPERASPTTLYGTTLVGAMITEALVLGWQLGDGDLCLIHPDGTMTVPLRQTAGTLGDETDSLCSSNAQLLMRTYWAPRNGIETPVLVALSTDGLSKSFISFEGYMEFIAGIHRLLQRDGTAKVNEEIPGWLQKASSFSGDDTTLLIAWREHASSRQS